MNITLHHRTPTLTEYQALRSLVLWPAFEERAAQTSLNATIFGVVVEAADGRIAGMGRVIGDGVLYFHIHDVIVAPDFQRQGIGKMIMHAVLDYTDEKAGRNAQIALSSSKGREPFYRALGFTERPSERLGAGMVKVKFID